MTFSLGKLTNILNKASTSRKLRNRKVRSIRRVSSIRSQLGACACKRWASSRVSGGMPPRQGVQIFSASVAIMFPSLSKLYHSSSRRALIGQLQMQRRPLPQVPTRSGAYDRRYPSLSACPCCGSGALRKIGEDVTEMLELIPRQWNVIQHVREKFSFRVCETITKPPAPSHPIARERAGRGLLAHIPCGQKIKTAGKTRGYPLPA